MKASLQEELGAYKSKYTKQVKQQVKQQVYKASKAASKASNAAALQEELGAYKAAEVRLKERIKDKDQQVLKCTCFTSTRVQMLTPVEKPHTQASA